MTDDTALIDFTELVENVPGEGLEELTRLLGRRKGLSPAWSGRGADSGRDLLFTEILVGPLAQEKVSWLVSCKHKAKSGDSVGERDLAAPSITDKLIQHKANGFLLVTTTTISTAAKALMDSLDKRNGGNIHTLVWDSAELTQMLLEPANEDLLKQFLPKSYERVKGLTSLEGAVLAFRDKIPEGVLTEIMRMVKPYSTSSLKGTLVWPHDIKSAEAIDEIVANLLIKQDIDAAVTATEQIEYDAFVALVNTLINGYSEACRSYLLGIVSQHVEPNIRFNAAQLLFDNYELDKVENLDIATHLDSNALEVFYASEIVDFVTEEIALGASDYDVDIPLDEQSDSADIIDVFTDVLSITPNIEERQIQFSGKMTIGVIYSSHGEEVREHGEQFSPGVFSGYFDEDGMYLSEASIDTG